MPFGNFNFGRNKIKTPKNIGEEILELYKTQNSANFTRESQIILVNLPPRTAAYTLEYIYHKVKINMINLILLPMDPKTAGDILSQMNPKTAVVLLNKMDPEIAVNILSEMNHEIAGDILSEMDPEIAVDILSEMNPKTTGDVLSKMYPEIAVNILSEMNPKIAGRILSIIHTKTAVVLLNEMDPEIAGDILSKMDPIISGRILSNLDNTVILITMFNDNNTKTITFLFSLNIYDTLMILNYMIQHKKNFAEKLLDSIKDDKIISVIQSRPHDSGVNIELLKLFESSKICNILHYIAVHSGQKIVESILFPVVPHNKSLLKIIIDNKQNNELIAEILIEIDEKKTPYILDELTIINKYNTSQVIHSMIEIDNTKTQTILLNTKDDAIYVGGKRKRKTLKMKRLK